MQSRRAAVNQIAASCFTLALARRAVGAIDSNASVSRATRRVLRETDRVSKDLAAHRIEAIEWQARIDALLGRIELTDLMRAIQFDRLAKAAVIPEDHELAERITFASAAGLPQQVGFAPFFFAMNRSTAIVPHGHHNMVSMHLVLEGQTRIRRFDRISNEESAVIIQPAGDEVAGPGAVSTVSDQKHNIHWFTAETDRVLFFNLQLWDLNSFEKTSGRDYLDPDHGERGEGGQLRVSRLTESQAYARYRALAG